jgi:archaellum component FlaG (FlaF/FlaG flagellin family)
MEKQQILEKALDASKKIGTILLFCIAVALGYSVCEIYHYTKNKSTQDAKSIDQVSVAINESGELMLIDRKSGEYEIYQDSIGEAIFNLYANKIQSRYETSN